MLNPEKFVRVMETLMSMNVNLTELLAYGRNRCKLNTKDLVVSIFNDEFPFSSLFSTNMCLLCIVVTIVFQGLKIKVLK